MQLTMSFVRIAISHAKIYMVDVNSILMKDFASYFRIVHHCYLGAKIIE
jgi:hypothetical protein